MKSTLTVTLLALCLHVGACGEETYTVVRGSCSAIVQGTVLQGDDRTYSTVQVSGGCTGTYIAPGVVLTAKHCGNPAYVQVGGPHTNVPVEVASNILYVPHPHKDAALMFLDRELAIPTATLGTANYGSALVQGYGSDENGQQGTLREAYAEIIEFWHPDTARTASGPDTCFGDSGGPMYQEGTLVAMTRSGLPSKEGTGLDQCGQGGLYTLVTSLKTWLDSEVDGLNWASYCN